MVCSSNNQERHLQCTGVRCSEQEAIRDGDHSCAFCGTNVGPSVVHKNYTDRRVSSLCFIAKILEKLVLSQVSSYLNSHNLCNTCQSAYRPSHSTETALLKVVNDLFLSLNKGNISVLALLDFSSAFDTIDHTILVHRLHTDFGFTVILTIHRQMRTIFVETKEAEQD